MSPPRIARALLLLAPLAAPLSSAIADGTRRGAREVEAELRIDLGAYAECAPWRYEVRRGDTLGEIAERHLGRVRRSTEILALNPGLDPRVLPAGRVLWMPPRRSPGWHFFAEAPDGSVVRVASGDALPSGRAGARLFAVPQDRMARILAEGAARRLSASRLDDDAVVARSESVFPPMLLPSEDGMPPGAVTYHVARVDGMTLELERVGQAERAPDDAPLSAVGPAGSHPDPSLLWALAAVAVLALGIALARRASREP
jgi:hypothetical protein